MKFLEEESFVYLARNVEPAGPVHYGANLGFTCSFKQELYGLYKYIDQ